MANNRLEEIRGRWQVFETKVEARLEEVLTEAAAGFDEVVATEVLDPAPLASALCEFTARLQGLNKKADEAFQKLDAELDQAMDQAGVLGIRSVVKVRDELIERREALYGRIESRGQDLSARKAAQGARALQELAKKEMAEAAAAARCSTCKAPIEPKVLHQASNVTCAHCQAVNTVSPGAATALVYGGSALHYLASEAALPLAAAMGAAERKYRSRDRGATDARRYEEATLAYWGAYCKARGSLIPGWDPAQLERDVQGKTGWLRIELERDGFGKR